AHRAGVRPLEQRAGDAAAGQASGLVTAVGPAQGGLKLVQPVLERRAALGALEVHLRDLGAVAGERVGARRLEVVAGRLGGNPASILGRKQTLEERHDYPAATILVDTRVKNVKTVDCTLSTVDSPCLSTSP